VEAARAGRATSAVNVAARRRPALRGGGWLTSLAFLAPSLALFSVFIFWPLVRTVYLSFLASDIIGRPTIFVGLRQYEQLFTSPSVRDVLGTTVLFSLLTVVPSLVLAVLVALLLQQRLAGIGIFRTLMATPFAFSVATASVVFAIFFNPGVGVLNGFLQLLHLGHGIGWLTDPNWALPSIALTSVWLQLGYNVLVLSAGLNAIPEEIYEAARLDGANGFTMARRVTLPLLTPTLFFLLVVTTIISLQSFGQIHILTRGGPAGATTTLVYSIYVNAFAFGNSNFGLASAQAMVLFFIVLAVTAVQFGVLERRVFYR
jgi:sn-glycerol 3-phosphate transport system permease protein